MVSPLSSRIINLEAKAKIKNNSSQNQDTNKKNNQLPWQLESRRKRISGYTADRESPSQRTAIATDKRVRAQQVEANAKKKKVEEQNFQAFNVKEDLAECGVKYLPRPHGGAFPILDGSIDMSHVELVMASNYKSDIDQNVRSDQPTYAYRDNSSVYASLIDQAKPYYKEGIGRKVVGFVRRNDNSYSFASCSTGESSSQNIDSDECEDDTALLSPASILRKQETEQLEKSTAPANHDSTSNQNSTAAVNQMFSISKTKSTTLESALFNCESAKRLIIKAEIPHFIVHASAAFSKLSDIPSDELLGSSLATFLSAKQNVETVSILTPKAQKSNHSPSYSVAISHVLSGNGSGAACHFVLDFEEVDTSSSSPSSNKIGNKFCCSKVEKQEIDEDEMAIRDFEKREATSVIG